MSETLTTAEPDAKRPRPRKEDAPRVPKVGDAVHYWNAHPAKEVGAADEPCHAVVARVRVDGDAIVCNLALLRQHGGWGQVTGSRFSEVPKVNCWTWPK